MAKRKKDKLNQKNDIDPYNPNGIKTIFGNNKTKRSGGERPSNVPKGFFD